MGYAERGDREPADRQPAAAVAAFGDGVQGNQRGDQHEHPGLSPGQSHVYLGARRAYHQGRKRPAPANRESAAGRRRGQHASESWPGAAGGLPAEAREQGRGEHERRRGQVGRAPMVPGHVEQSVQRQRPVQRVQPAQRVQPVEGDQRTQSAQWAHRAHATTIGAVRRPGVGAAA